MTEIASLPEPTAFGVLVRKRRKALNWSTETAAIRAGVSPSRWNQIERGYVSRTGGYKEPVNPKRDTVLRIALAIGLPVVTALQAAGFEPDPDDPEPIDLLPQQGAEEEIQALLPRMSEPQRQSALAVMRTMVDPHAPVELEQLAS